MTPPTAETTHEVVRKLKRLKHLTEHFGLKHCIDRIIAWAESGPHDKPLVIGVDKRNIIRCRLMLDSGAFSARRAGVSIDLADYIAFIKEHGTTFEHVVNLDSIPKGPSDVDRSASESYRNLQAMKRPCDLYRSSISKKTSNFCDACLTTARRMWGSHRHPKPSSLLR